MDLQKTGPEQPVSIPHDLKDIFMKTVFSGLTEEEAIVAYRLARRRNLDIESKQIFFIPYTDKQGRRTVVSQTSIDGLRLIASKSGNYGGSVNPRLTIKDKNGAKHVIPHEEYDPAEADQIVSATISVINTEFPQPQIATALYSSYARTYDGRPTGLWATMPDVMLLKCAESMALRKAFPQDLSGIYTSEEMGQVMTQGIPPKTVSVKTSLKDFRPKKPSIDQNGQSSKSNRQIPATDDVTDVEITPVVVQPADQDTGAGAINAEIAPPRKKQTIEDLIAMIPDGLRKMKPDVDPDIFDYCKYLCLDFLNVESVKDCPEERIEDLRQFMRTTMIEKLREHGYL